MPAAHFTSLGNSKLDSSYTHKIINWPQFIKMVPWSSKTIYLANNKVQKTSLYSTKFSFDHYGTGEKKYILMKKIWSKFIQSKLGMSGLSISCMSL